MTIKQNVFSGGTNGADISDANSGGASGDAFTGVTVSAGSLTYSNTHTVNGTLSAQVSGTGSGTSYAYWDGFAGKNFAVRGKFWFDAATTTDTPLLWIGAGSTQVARIQRKGSGKLEAQTTSGTSAWLSTGVPASGAWVRYELRVVVGTTTSNGEIHAAWYPDNSSTVVEEVHLTGQNLGTVDVTRVRMGRAATSSFTGSYWMGALKANDSTTSFVGPVPSSPPIVSANGSDAYLIDATASATTGTPTYSIAQSSGPTLAPVGFGTGRWRVARSADADRVYDVTITDDVGTATQSVTVPKQVASNTAASIGRRRLKGGVLLP